MLELVAHGHSSKEIGRILGASHETVRKHIARIRDSLGLRRAAEMAAFWHSLKRPDVSATFLLNECAENLTPREKEVACLLVRGFSAKEVAAELGIAQGTAAKHRENLLGKLGVGKTSLLPLRLGQR